MPDERTDAGGPADTVLVVCSDEDCAAQIMSRLFDHGFSAIGPIATARMALALAAQHRPTLALMARPPTGRRNASELAQTLMRDWNIRSWVLSDPAQPDDRRWSPRPEQRSRLAQALEGLTLASN